MQFSPLTGILPDFILKALSKISKLDFFAYIRNKVMSESSVTRSTGSCFTCFEPWLNRSQHSTNGALVHSNSSVKQLLCMTSSLCQRICSSPPRTVYFDSPFLKSVYSKNQNNVSTHLTIKNKNCSNPRTAMPKKKILSGNSSWGFILWLETRAQLPMVKKKKKKNPNEKGSVKQTTPRKRRSTFSQRN